MNKPIYKPKGKAGEYGDYAINIYDSCNHGCTYCYARPMAARFGRPWGDVPKPREGIVEVAKNQLAHGHIKGQLIHLCFTCDPYPAEIDTTTTREIIQAIKASGNHVQILTKGGDRAQRDFDLLDNGDAFGVTISGDDEHMLNNEPMAAGLYERLNSLKRAHELGIKTWVSFEPVYIPSKVYLYIMIAEYIDLYKIGKLNHHPSDINWGAFGRECERLCMLHGRNYYIKDDLRKEMEAHP